MPYNKTTALLNQMKGETVKVSGDIVPGMVLPNHSGMKNHPEATTFLTTTDAATTYLKLDCSNDPLTAGLEINTGDLTINDGTYTAVYDGQSFTTTAGSFSFNFPGSTSFSLSMSGDVPEWNIPVGDEIRIRSQNDTPRLLLAAGGGGGVGIYMEYDGLNSAIVGQGDLTITAIGGDISFGNERIVTTGTLASGALTVTGNIAVTGTVDGIDIAEDVTANTTHRTSNGTDHSYIDQDVTSGATPTFGNIKGETKSWDITIIDPNGIYGYTPQVFIAWATAALTITKIQIECDGSFNLNCDLKWADDFRDLTSAAVIDVCDTGADGKITITSGFDDADIASGKAVYFQMDPTPSTSIKQVHVHIEWDYD